jgi:hypothetical protein
VRACWRSCRRSTWRGGPSPSCGSITSGAQPVPGMTRPRTWLAVALWGLGRVLPGPGRGGHPGARLRPQLPRRAAGPRDAAGGGLPVRPRPRGARHRVRRVSCWRAARASPLRSPGDEVIALAAAAHASRVVARAHLTVHKPPNAVARRGGRGPQRLRHRRVRPRSASPASSGKRVLIHSATGAVGLAAIQHCRRVGARSSPPPAPRRSGRTCASARDRARRWTPGRSPSPTRCCARRTVKASTWC